MKKWVICINTNQEKCKSLKSRKLFSQMIGDSSGAYVEMGEFRSLGGHERFMHRNFPGIDELINSIMLGFKTCVVPGSYFMNTWNSVI